jgi:hypothetical protein
VSPLNTTPLPQADAAIHHGACFIDRDRRRCVEWMVCMQRRKEKLDVRVGFCFCGGEKDSWLQLHVIEPMILI